MKNNNTVQSKVQLFSVPKSHGLMVTWWMKSLNHSNSQRLWEKCDCDFFDFRLPSLFFSPPSVWSGRRHYFFLRYDARAPTEPCVICDPLFLHQTPETPTFLQCLPSSVMVMKHQGNDEVKHQYWKHIHTVYIIQAFLPFAQCLHTCPSCACHILESRSPDS